MKRILPFRTVSPHDEIPFFAVLNANSSISDTGDGDAGVVVSVTSGNFGQNPVEYKVDSILGYAGGPNMGFNQYPDAQLKVKACASTERPVGITLKETCNYDENGNKLIYDRSKKDQLGCVVSGEPTLLATKGMFTFTYRAFGTGTNKSYVPAPGSRLVVSATDGCLTGLTEAFWRTGSSLPSVGVVLTTGTQVSLNGNAEYYSSGTDSFAVATCLIDIG